MASYFDKIPRPGCKQIKTAAVSCRFDFLPYKNMSEKRKFFIPRGEL